MVAVLYQQAVRFATKFRVTSATMLAAAIAEIYVVAGPAPALALAVHWLTISILPVFGAEWYVTVNCQSLLGSMARWFLSQLTLKR